MTTADLISTLTDLLARASPTPWRVVQDHLGHWRIIWAHSDRSSVSRGDKVFDEGDAAIITLLRNHADRLLLLLRAEEIMVRREWIVKRWRGPVDVVGWWGVLNRDSYWPPELLTYKDNHHDTPAQALVSADDWLREREEREEREE